MTLIPCMCQFFLSSPVIKHTTASDIQGIRRQLMASCCLNWDNMLGDQDGNIHRYTIAFYTFSIATPLNVVSIETTFMVFSLSILARVRQQETQLQLPYMGPTHDICRKGFWEQVSQNSRCRNCDNFSLFFMLQTWFHMKPSSTVPCNAKRMRCLLTKGCSSTLMAFEKQKHKITKFLDGVSCPYLKVLDSALF